LESFPFETVLRVMLVCFIGTFGFMLEGGLTMKKSRSKTLIMFSLVIVLMLGSGQVYASTALDTNILNLIRQIFNENINAFDQTIYEETQKLADQKKDRFDSYIDVSTNKVIGNIENHIDLEINRANDELDSYIEELMRQMDGIMEDEENRLKELVTNHVDESIQVMKNYLHGYLYVALEEHLLETISPRP